MTMKITCNCGNAIYYSNPCEGCVNVGHFQQETGWAHHINLYDYTAIWMCPDCQQKVAEAARLIVQVVGHPDISLRSIVGRDIGYGDY
jgi:hypothetical protein